MNNLHLEATGNVIESYVAVTPEDRSIFRVEIATSFGTGWISVVHTPFDAQCVTATSDNPMEWIDDKLLGWLVSAEMEMGTARILLEEQAAYVVDNFLAVAVA